MRSGKLSITKLAKRQLTWDRAIADAEDELRKTGDDERRRRLANAISWFRFRRDSGAVFPGS